jgi:hypothetical protein
VLALPLLPRAARDLSSLADRRTWRFMIPGVVVGTYISLLLWMGGFKFADASVASALNQTATLFTFGLAVLILKEPVTRKGLVGLATGTIVGGAAFAVGAGMAAYGGVRAVSEGVSELMHREDEEEGGAGGGGGGGGGLSDPHSTGRRLGSDGAAVATDNRRWWERDW